VRRPGIRARWALPVGVVAAAGIVVGVSAAASAAVPSLPAKTPAQLLTELAQAAGRPVSPLTATVQQTASFGLPELPGMSQASGATSSLLDGTQAIDIWYGGPKLVRIATPVPAGESDLRRDGSTVWLWNSKTQTATQVTLPAHVQAQKGNGAAGAGGTSQSPQPPDTPQAAASQLLAAIGPSTVVGVQSNVYVADRPAYQLSLAPKSSQSLVGRVLVAVDASSGIPLRVEVYGRGSAGLAYSLGYTKLAFGAPDAANFSFTPPPGATVKKQTVPSDPGALLPGSTPPGSGATGQAGKPTVIGADWLSVVATPADPAVAAAVQQLLTGQPATPQSGSSGGGFFGSSSSSAAPGPSASASVPVGPYLEPLRALLLASRPVSWPGGSGRLLQTTLFSVLVTSKGQILAGAVTPSVLYADVAQDAG
jgi:outer membrane lipoprotein-sorting protein